MPFGYQLYGMNIDSAPSIVAEKLVFEMHARKPTPPPPPPTPPPTDTPTQPPTMTGDPTMQDPSAMPPPPTAPNENAPAAAPSEDPANSIDGGWEESFDGHTDSKPNGKASPSPSNYTTTMRCPTIVFDDCK